MSQESNNEGELQNKNDVDFKVHSNTIVYKTTQIDILDILSKLEEQQLGPEIYKYEIISNKNGNLIDNQTKLKIFLEERDSNGILLNKDKQVQLIRFSMKSPKPESKLIKILLLSMRDGEESWFKVYEKVQDSERLKNESDEKQKNIKYYKIKIIETQEIQKAADQTTIESRIKQFEQFRIDGKNLFDKNQFEGAIKKYKKGINYMEAWPRQFDQDNYVKERKKYYYQLFCSNISQCYIFTQEYDKAIMILEDILPQCRGNEFEIKNYYRIIVCYIKVGILDKAQRYLQEVKYLCELNNDQKSLFGWLDNECKPIKKVKI